MQGTDLLADWRSMSSDDLSIYLFLWGSAFAFALGAITMVDSKRKVLLWSLWGVASAFLIAALVWPWAAEKWPNVKKAILGVSGNQIALNILGLSVFGLLVLDFLMRRQWLVMGRYQTKEAAPDNSALNDSLRALLERVGRIEQLPASATAEDHHQLAVSVENLTKAAGAQANRSIQEGRIERDILLLMHFVIYQSTVIMLDGLLEIAPMSGVDAPLRLGGDLERNNKLSEEFVTKVRRTLDPGSSRRQRFEVVMGDAESAAEREIEDIQISERPAGVDPLHMRKWAIVQRQCSRAVAFLDHERGEAYENLRGQRHNLLQRYGEINPG